MEVLSTYLALFMAFYYHKNISSLLPKRIQILEQRVGFSCHLDLGKELDYQNVSLKLHEFPSRMPLNHVGSCRINCTSNFNYACDVLTMFTQQPHCIIYFSSCFKSWIILAEILEFVILFFILVWFFLLYLAKALMIELIKAINTFGFLITIWS